MRILTDHFYNLLFRLCDARMRVLCFFCNLFCNLPDLFCNLFCNLTDLFCNLELNLYSHAVRIEGLLENRLCISSRLPCSVKLRQSETGTLANFDK